MRDPGAPTPPSPFYHFTKDSDNSVTCIACHIEFYFQHHTTRAIYACVFFFFVVFFVFSASSASSAALSSWACRFAFR